MIGAYNHLLSKVFRFHHHSHKVIGSLRIYPPKNSIVFFPSFLVAKLGEAGHRFTPICRAVFLRHFVVGKFADLPQVVYRRNQLGKLSNEKHPGTWTLLEAPKNAVKFDHLEFFVIFTWMSMEVIVTIVSKLCYFTYLGDEVNLLILGLGHLVTKYHGHPRSASSFTASPRLLGGKGRIRPSFWGIYNCPLWRLFAWSRWGVFADGPNLRTLSLKIHGTKS